MAEERNRFQKALDALRGREDKGRQGSYNQLFGNDTSVYGYNTTAGFWETDQLDEIGDGSANSAVIACLNVLSTAFSEPTLNVVKQDNFGNVEKLGNHPISKLYARPNPFMSAGLLNHYIVLAINTIGDAFLYKNRNKTGQVVQLVPIMPGMVQVRGNEQDLITHYEYYQHGNGEPLIIPVDDMVHIRQGIDPNDHRRGHAPLKGVLREILGDEAAGQWSAALLHNMAVPGVVLSPRNDSLGGPTREEAEAISESYKTKFGGANRGAPMVLSGSMNVDIVSFSPDQMKLQELRRLPEERISAVLGVPAILAGLGAGLDSATYNNTRELREFFTEQKLIPMWKTVANELSHQLLLKDFKDEESKCEFDYSEVRALQEDMDELYKRVNTGVQGGWITIGEARKVVGLEADDKHDIYLRPLNTIQITEDGQPLLERDRFLEEGKDLLSSGDLAESTRDNRIIRNEEPRGEEKYVAQMPNGSWCVIGHDDEEVIKCFKTKPEADRYLENMKKSYVDSYNDTTVDLVKATISARIKKILQGKVTDHNAKNPKYRATYGMLAASFRRGVGAYNTNPGSVRPSVTSSDQWALARVNGLLRALRTGKFKNKPYDTDLLPSNHPLSSKKSYEIDEINVSYEEAEVLYESDFELEPENIKYANTEDVFDNPGEAMERSKELSCAIGVHTHEMDGDTVYMPCKTHSEYEEATKPSKSEKPKKDRTNFPSPGDDMQVRISNSKYKMFPYSYAKDLKENWPEIWRLAGRGGKDAFEDEKGFTGDDAYRNWTKYQAGDRSESVLNWVRRRERFMGRHQGNTRLNGTIANIKWGGVSNIGLSAMKKIINERKKLVRSRRKKALDTQSEILDDLFSKKVSKNVSKILESKVSTHNASNPLFKTNLRTLVEVFDRGHLAYNNNESAKKDGSSSADHWGLARVQGFLYALSKGMFKRKPYDVDLLPSLHPLSSNVEKVSRSET